MICASLLSLFPGHRKRWTWRETSTKVCQGGSKWTWRKPEDCFNTDRGVNGQKWRWKRKGSYSGGTVGRSVVMRAMRENGLGTDCSLAQWGWNGCKGCHVMVVLYQNKTKKKTYLLKCCIWFFSWSLALNFPRMTWTTCAFWHTHTHTHTRTLFFPFPFVCALVCVCLCVW